MKYDFLSERLWPVANNIIDYFVNTQGVPRRKFEKEKPISRDINYITTLHAITRDYHYLCVEIIENKYPNALDAFVIDCIRRSIPVRLYIAFAKDQLNANEYRDMVGQAKDRCIGLLEDVEGNINIINDALSLSLIGVRETDTRRFPPKYRANLSQGESTFKNGNPVKGCSDIYDEIEALSREICNKTKQNGFWKTSGRGGATSRIQCLRSPWANVMSSLFTGLDFNKVRPSCPQLDQALIARVLGITRARNESGHKIKNPNGLMRRDSRLKTRFEDAIDLLLDLINASKQLRV